MKLGAWLLFWFVTVPAPAAVFSFPGLGRAAVEATWAELARCGLERRDAHSPFLPPPHVPALEAVVNVRGKILAYSFEWYGRGGATYEFKNPNGGLSHFVRYSSETIAFQTPYSGIVAQASRYTTPQGVGFHFLCGSLQLPSERAFKQCITANWTDVIAEQLCRYARYLDSSAVSP